MQIEHDLVYNCAIVSLLCGHNQLRHCSANQLLSEVFVDNRLYFIFLSTFIFYNYCKALFGQGCNISFHACGCRSG